MSSDNQTQTDSIIPTTSDDTEILPNPERGCGYLKEGKAYIRADLSPLGTLPAFVEFNTPIPFKEDRKRSYKAFPGIQFELSVTGESGPTKTVPEGEVFEHIRRLSEDNPTGRTAGEMVSFHSHDLLMSVGRTHYETAEEFITEAKVHGVNKAISVTSGNEPPEINPGRTRLFLIHPGACEYTVTETEEQEITKKEKVQLPNGETKTVAYRETEEVEVEVTKTSPGIIGYTYLTRVVYTEDEDGNVPQYVQDYEAMGDLDVVQIGDEESYADQKDFTEDGDYAPQFEPKPAIRRVDGDAERVDRAADRLREVQAVVDGDAEPPTFAPKDYPSVEPVENRQDLTAVYEGETDVADLERANLGVLAENGEVEGYIPPESHDAMNGDDDGLLALVREEDELVAVRPGASVNVESGPLWDYATTVAGPYRVTVTDARDGGRLIQVERTR